MPSFTMSAPAREEFKVSAKDADGHPRARRARMSVTTMRVDPQVWKLALYLADGNVRRIEIISETDVRVRNGERCSMRPTR